ncbi:MAG: CDP-alcohol phosphatidyltransferase family protein [Rhizobiaceae bacterium]|nr:CDP-alcohol phosphatidyltransferase family protein [Rhizobiaceae bacterium]
MFDKSVRAVIDPLLDRIARSLAEYGATPNGVTWLGFALGVAAAVSIAFNSYYWGLALMLASRLCDGLDGAVARADSSHRGATDLGGFLDIVLDFAFYGIIPFAFILADPTNNALAGGLLLLVFYANGASFLTFALMLEKRGLEGRERGSKSLVYTAGLAEATETIFVFMLFCLFPDWFSVIAYGFSVIVVITTVTRFVLAYQVFGEN